MRDETNFRFGAATGLHNKFYLPVLLLFLGAYFLSAYLRRKICANIWLFMPMSTRYVFCFRAHFRRAQLTALRLQQQ